MRIFIKAFKSVALILIVGFAVAISSPAAAEGTEHGDCGICLYEHTNYRGSKFCMKLGEQVLDFSKHKMSDKRRSIDNQASSVKFFRNSCDRGSQLVVQLKDHQSPDLKDKVHLTRDVPNLGTFNDKASSALIRQRSALEISQQCRVCLYDEPAFRGDRRCLDINTLADWNPLMKDRGFNNKIASIQFELNGCTGGAAVFYEDEFEGQRFAAYKDLIDLRMVRRGRNSNWFKQISSVRFDPWLRPNFANIARKMQIENVWAHPQ